MSRVGELADRVIDELEAQLYAERAKREEAERNYYTLCDTVCRDKIMILRGTTS